MVILGVDDMIRIKSKEWEDNNTAYSEKCISFLGIPLFKRTDCSTNNDIVNSLKVKKVNKVKGFQQ